MAYCITTIWCLPLVQKGQIHLVDSGATPLKPMSKTSQNEVHRVLTNLGVRILSGTLVQDYQDDKVIYLSRLEIKKNKRYNVHFTYGERTRR